VVAVVDVERDVERDVGAVSVALAPIVVLPSVRRPVLRSRRVVRDVAVAVERAVVDVVAVVVALGMPMQGPGVSMSATMELAVGECVCKLWLPQCRVPDLTALCAATRPRSATALARATGARLRRNRSEYQQQPPSCRDPPACSSRRRDLPALSTTNCWLLLSPAQQI
jgi:hypothetical protein